MEAIYKVQDDTLVNMIKFEASCLYFQEEAKRLDSPYFNQVYLHELEVVVEEHQGCFFDVRSELLQRLHLTPELGQGFGLILVLR